MLADDRRLSLRMIAEEWKRSLDSVSNIIHEHLQKHRQGMDRGHPTASGTGSQMLTSSTTAFHSTFCSTPSTASRRHFGPCEGRPFSGQGRDHRQLPLNLLKICRRKSMEIGCPLTRTRL
ncbi:hypothetical protein AVEN_226149-1 [Araneus ventricosus]|uniref:Uncharacterized protein n=1 Tax=Araneus ventricosus TaxID=182803 RepID=A0A4Y2M101_ARAVE|nr:hypothetical protein AVEN_226149-1 [Araneus ventricosus]